MEEYWQEKALPEGIKLKVNVMFQTQSHNTTSGLNLSKTGGRTCGDEWKSRQKVLAASYQAFNDPAQAANRSRQHTSHTEGTH